MCSLFSFIITITRIATHALQTQDRNLQYLFTNKFFTDAVSHHYNNNISNKNVFAAADVWHVFNRILKYSYLFQDRRRVGAREGCQESQDGRNKSTTRPHKGFAVRTILRFV